MSKTNVRTIVEAIIEGAGEGAVKGLRGLELSGADLSKLDLTCADLCYKDLRKTCLQGACLYDADLHQAILSGADLRDADLGCANLFCAVLDDADLTGANLDYANLGGADLSGAKGLLDPIEFISEHFESTKDGIIAYKVFNLYHSPSPDWDISPGAILEETVNPCRTWPCASGINLSTKGAARFNAFRWAKEAGNPKPEREIWRCLIRWEWLPSVVVPYSAKEDFRCGKLQLLEALTYDELAKEISDES